MTQSRTFTAPLGSQGRGCQVNRWGNFQLHPELSPLAVQIKAGEIPRRFVPFLSTSGFG